MGGVGLRSECLHGSNECERGEGHGVYSREPVKDNIPANHVTAVGAVTMVLAVTIRSLLFQVNA